MAGIIHYEASWLTAQHSCASVSKILNPARSDVTLREGTWQACQSESVTQR